MKKVYDFGNDILNNYKSFNIDDVEVITSENISLSVKSRQQKLENIERSKNFNIGINIYKDKKKKNCYKESTRKDKKITH